MSIFGNGVINGWTVTAEESFTVSIGEGFGNINFIAGRTTFPASISDIPPNSVNYVFAKILRRTLFAEDVEFILSSSRNLNDPNFLLLAQITTGPLSIENVDNSVRQRIAFLEIIRAAIRDHKHRGGSLNPSKIDLTSEVKGQLPGFRLAPFDAEKISTGTFDLARMPSLDHQRLLNTGLLTHPQLDTFVKSLEVNNKELFGEIGTANLLQLIIAMKYIYEDPNSSFYIADTRVDERMINELAVIPGITPDKHIDFDHSTSIINLQQHFIEGIPPTTGTSFYVTYNTALAWKSAFSRDRVIIAGDTVTLAFDDEEESRTVTIEGFESATAPGQDLSGGTGGQELFKKETVVISDTARITANASSTNVLEGFYSGQFQHQQSFRSQFVKEFTQPQNWSTYDSFVLNVKCIDSIHGAVKLYFLDEQNNRSIDFIVLNQDEITDNADPTTNDFEVRIIDLATVSFRDKVKKIVVFTDDVKNPFKFFIDFINIQRAVLLPEEGVLKLRYSSAAKLTFSYIDWNSSEPTGTSIEVRARSASGTVFLTRAEYTPVLSSGELINLDGTDIEIEIVFRPDDQRLVAPVLQQMRILIITQADIDGFLVNSEETFSRGKTENVDIESSPVSLQISDPIRVGSYYFCLGNSVNQVHEETTASDNTFVNSELRISGTDAPIAPNQIWKSVEDEVFRVSLSSLFEPRGLRRQAGRTFVIADTYNDRVLEFNEDGELLSGIGSVNYEHSSKVFPLSAAFDVRTGILYIVWSKQISFKAVNVSKITLQTATEQVQLIKDFDKIMGLSTSELNSVNAEGQIMPIHLADQNAAITENLSGSAYLFAASDAISTGLDADSVFYKAVATALGIPLFIGNFAYIDGIFSPTFADKTSEGGYIIANATIAIKDYEFPQGINETIIKREGVSSIIEVDKDNRIVFGSNVLSFSPFIPGRAQKISKNTLLIGGIKPDGEEGTPETTAPFDFRSISGDSETKNKQKTALEKIFFGGSKPFGGAVVLFDKQTQATTFEYLSASGILVSDVEINPVDGTYVVAESSFTKAGRIIKLDASGNIVFSHGEGLYSIVNNVRVQVDGSIVVST